MLAVMRLGRVILFAADVGRLRDFYREAFGLAVIEDSPGWVRLDADGTELALHAIPGAPPVAEPPHPRADVPVKLVFEVDDLDAARERLSRLAPMRAPVEGHSDGVDPEGNVFQIAARPPKALR
jgi:catechol 2,3-dioxygenase-like lactoylglutathione lyase family enzyme